MFDSTMEVHFLVILTSILGISHTQELFPGWCPPIKPMNSFLIKNYSGSWYEIEKYWFIPEAQSSCVNVIYTDNGDETFKVNIVQQVNGKVWENPGITRYLSTDGSGSFLLDLIVSQSPLPFVVSYPYIVIDTDYHDYTIKYACKQIGFYNMQTMWILSKNKSISPAVRQTIYEKLLSLGLDITRLKASNLSTCPQTPTSS